MSCMQRFKLLVQRLVSAFWLSLTQRAESADMGTPALPNQVNNDVTLTHTLHGKHSTR